MDGSNTSFAITNASLVDGLDFGVGQSITDVKDGTTTSTDIETVIGYANYTVGPVTVGYTQGETSGGVAGHDQLHHHLFHLVCNQQLLDQQYS